MNGAYTLAHVRADKLHIECGRCDRHGSYAVARLIAKYGADQVLPEVLRQLILESQCPHGTDAFDACKAKFTRESVLSWTKPEELEVVRQSLK